MHKAAGKYQFEDLLSTHAVIHNIHCMQIQNLHDQNNLTICSYANDANRALFIACPKGGATISVEKTLRQEAAQLMWKATTGKLQLNNSFVVHAKRSEWTSSTMTMVADKVQLQSSVDPFEIHSFSTQRQGLAFRCPKGGISTSSGTGGISTSTTGSVDFVLESPYTHIRLASRGNKKHTIHLGNNVSETIVANQLTVRGKLVLNDDTVIERHVSKIRELQNVIKLACQDTPDNAFDYGFVASGPNGTQSGLIYDHQRDRFYFSTRLGIYQHKRFALPQSYADVQARAFLAQHKIHSPFIETSTIQCRTIRHPTELALQAPRVHCTQRFACNALHADVLHASTHTKTNSLSVEHEAAVNVLRADHIHISDEMTIGGKGALCVDRWLWNTVGIHGRYKTLQDFLDNDDQAPDTDTRGKMSHVVFESTTTPHNCNATLDRQSVVLDGRHSILTGILELTSDCESVLIVDARISHFTIVSAPEASGETTSTSSVDKRMKQVSIVLRNVHGHAKDWAFQLPEGRLTFEQCDIEFQNQVLGELEKITTTHSTIRGTPWRQLVLHKTNT